MEARKIERINYLSKLIPKLERSTCLSIGNDSLEHNGKPFINGSPASESDGPIIWKFEGVLTLGADTEYFGDTYKKLIEEVISNYKSQLKKLLEERVMYYL